MRYAVPVWNTVYDFINGVACSDNKIIIKVSDNFVKPIINNNFFYFFFGFLFQ